MPMQDDRVEFQYQIIIDEVDTGTEMDTEDQPMHPAKDKSYLTRRWKTLWVTNCLMYILIWRRICYRQLKGLRSTLLQCKI